MPFLPWFPLNSKNCLLDFLPLTIFISKLLGDIDSQVLVVGLGITNIDLDFSRNPSGLCLLFLKCKGKQSIVVIQYYRNANEY